MKCYEILVLILIRYYISLGVISLRFCLCCIHFRRRYLFLYRRYSQVRLLNVFGIRRGGQDTTVEHYHTKRKNLTQNDILYSCGLLLHSIFPCIMYNICTRFIRSYVCTYNRRKTTLKCNERNANDP